MQRIESALHKLARDRARHRLVRVSLIGLVICTLLTGCGAGTTSVSYSCKGGCWTVLQLSHDHTDASGAPDLDAARLTGASSYIYPARLFCDDACRASSGDIANPGYIATVLCLYQADTGAWACTGYRTDAAGAEQYFVWYQVPGEKNVVVFLGSVPVTPGCFGIALSYVAFSISSYFGLDAPDGRWSVNIFPNACFDPITFTLPFKFLDFQPTAIQYTQFIAGTRGAAADIAVFTSNAYGVTMDHVYGSITDFETKWQTLKHDGVLSATGTATNPSFAEWFPTPSSSTYGGRYFVSCCTRLI